jgi:lipid-binding SYLF domain-containing protein
MSCEHTVRATGVAVAMALVACNKQEAPAAPSEPSTTTTANAPATTTTTTPSTDATANKATTAEGQQAKAEKAEPKRDSAELISDASATLQKMTADPKLKQLLGKASGVFIVPDYGRAAVGVGARGGQGVLLAHHDDKWSDPVFYNVGGIGVGAQFGAQGGQIAMVLMGEQPLSSFKGDNSFSLNAGANVNVVDYSAAKQASLGKGSKGGKGKAENEVIMWSDTKGAFAGATLSATDVSWDDDENKSYYGKHVTAQDVLSGNVTDDKKGPLQQALSSL